MRRLSPSLQPRTLTSSSLWRTPARAALLELDATAEEESRFLYQQGLADGVRLLGILVGPA